MRLKKLYVDNYKNLKGFSIYFESESGLSILVGNNGSGKSNILEVISGIFHDLYKEKIDRKIKCNYTLEYSLDGVECKIENRNGTLRCYAPKYKNRDRFIAENSLNNVIGLYSGEEDRLWKEFYQSYYNSYIRGIKSYQQHDRMRLVFIDKRYWTIALLTLLLSNNETLATFIVEELKILSTNKIIFHFNFHHYNNANVLLRAFIDRINPEHITYKEYTRNELNQRIYSDESVDSNGDALLDSNDEALIADSGITDAEVFRYLTQAYYSNKDKLIDEVSVEINNGITVSQLSEGEKKLILVKTVLEILSDEKTLVLMDEPDAHLHEGRKPSLINMMREYSNRQIIAATHSPIIAQTAREEELLMIESVDGKATLMSEEKREKIKRLSGDAWDIIGQEIVFQSKKPLVVFEGKTDVKYVKKALQMLQQRKPEYQRISVDFMSCGGADNAQFLIPDFLSLIPNEKHIYLFFDRDDAGRKGAAAVLGISKDDERITQYHDIEKDHFTVSFIPYREDVSSGDFLIEDYFLWEATVKSMVESAIENNHHPLKQLPSLAGTIKHRLEEDFYHFSVEEFLGFTPLIEKLFEISCNETHR